MAINPIVDSRDVRFVLFEMLEMDTLTKYPVYQDFDRDTFDGVLDLAETIAVEKVYPINSEADKKHCEYKPDTKEVIIPEEFFDGLNAYYEAGFMTLPVPQELGGMGMPHTMFTAATDYFSSAGIAFGMYPMLTLGALNMYYHFLPDGKRKENIAQKMLSGEWGGTMCLTESDAGTDVGALKTKAVKNDDGTYTITGQKIFISSGDNNYYKNMIHPVLARIEGDPPGTKGISIFMVPKYWVDEEGSMGEFNDVNCSGIEHKMGITASATCTLNFGDEGKCRGILMGEERKGMKIMFQMMNEARHFVGGQGLAVSSAAYMHAITYARNRVQGAHVTQMLNPEAKGVTIINHPDVKRMLLQMKSKVEAMRALTYYLGLQTDLLHVADDEETKKEAQALLEILTPICKAGNTDTAWNVTATAIQVYGGYGFCTDYPVEQYARDSKILSIYEGTNGIQSLDLTMRKILMNAEHYNYSVMKKRIQQTIDEAKGVVDDKYISLVSKGLEKLDATIEYLKKQLAENKFLHLFANATPLQEASTMLVYAWFHLMALVKAAPKMKELVGDKKGEERETFVNENKEAAYYSGRVLSAQFYIGAEFHQFFGKCDYITEAETAVIKSSDAIFTGAPEE